MINAIIMFFMVVLQNASFTLVSRARNSDNIQYHLGELNKLMELVTLDMTKFEKKLQLEDYERGTETNDQG